MRGFYRLNQHTLQDCTVLVKIAQATNYETSGQPNERSDLAHRKNNSTIGCNNKTIMVTSDNEAATCGQQAHNHKR